MTRGDPATARESARSSTPTRGTTRIHTIQGAAHLSPHTATTVTTGGIVTAKANSGFWIQEPDGTVDANVATSEGIFVFTSSAPTVSLGDAVQVSGTVTEFRGGGDTQRPYADGDHGADHPAALRGEPAAHDDRHRRGGRVPPASVIDDDAAGDVETDRHLRPGDRWDRLLRVARGDARPVKEPSSSGPRNAFGEIWVLADNGAGQSVRTTAAASSSSETDFNPERIQIDDTLPPPSPDTPFVTSGRRSQAPSSASSTIASATSTSSPRPYRLRWPAAITREVTQAAVASNELAVATFNVENLDPGDPDSKFQQLADLIVDNLQSPDLISLEEIQDDNGPTNNGTVTANADAR